MINKLAAASKPRGSETVEIWKALATLVAAAAVFAGGVLTVASWWHPAPQTINVRIEGSLPR